MTTLFTDTVLHMAGIQARLAAANGLPEATASSLMQDALPVMVRALGAPNGLGGPDAVRDMCQQLSAAQVHRNPAELTRPDGGWPEQRSHLAQALLGPGYFAALVQRHAPAAPGPVGQLLGSLGLVVLATAGQQAAEAQLNAAALQSWLREQGAAGHELPAGPRPPVASLPPAAALPASKTAPWWPLAVLAVVGIGASSYFWNEQTAAAAATLSKAAVALVRPGPPAAAAAPVALVAAPKAPARPAAVRKLPASTSPAKPALAAKLALKKTQKVSPIPARVPAGVADQLLAGTKEHFEGSPAEKPAAAAPPVAPHAAFKGNSSSAESQLFARLDNPDVLNRQPIVLERLAFALGEAALDAEGAQQLANVANLLKTYPRCRLIVFGNAESAEPHSITLALARANAVVAELVKLGVPSAALQAQGHLSAAAGAGSDPDYRRRPALYICSID